MGVHPEKLEPGQMYSIARKVPLMPSIDPGADAMKSLSEIIWLKSGIPFSIGRKATSSLGRWYAVVSVGDTNICDTGTERWINMNALRGMEITTLFASQEVSCGN